MEIESKSEGRSEGSDCGDIWIDGDILFGSLGALGALAFYYLYITITMKGRRKKRNAENKFTNLPSDWLTLGNFNWNNIH